MFSLDIVHSERLHDGYLKVDKVTVNSDDKPITNNVATAKDGVIVVLYDPKADKVLLIEEVRPAIALHAQNNPQLYTAANRPSGRLISCVLGGGLSLARVSMMRQGKKLQKKPVVRSNV